MDAHRLQRVSELFEAARVLPAGQREGFLRDACGDDADLLEQVRSLLEHHERPGESLDVPLVQTPMDAASLAAARPSAAMPQRIGGYHIIRKIGEGGMGTVFEARQENPRGPVALKIIHARIASAGMLRRFAHEAPRL